MNFFLVLPMGSEKADWRCAMNLRPVEGIRAVGPAEVKRLADDVSPAFAVEAAGLLEQDSYGGSSQGQSRGLEEEDADSLDENEAAGRSPGVEKLDVVA